MKNKKAVWDSEKTLEKLKKLMEPGVIGFYKSVEITEIIGVRGSALTHFLTLAVAEPTEPPATIDWKSVLLNGRTRHRLVNTDFDIGIAQYRLSIQTFIEKIAEFDAAGKWQSGQSHLQIGKLVSVPPQFVPSDGSGHHPWNGILKNNFFEGSHVFELFDTEKPHVRFLFEDSRRLTNLASIVGKYLPIKIDGLSDRLGNVIFQLPVSVISTAVRSSAEGNHSIAIAWHPEVTPRQVRISAEIWQDSTVFSFDSAVLLNGAANLQLNAPGGGARSNIWDDENKILLSATAPVRFITAGSVSVSIDESGHARSVREFVLTDSTGNQAVQTISLSVPAKPSRLFGENPVFPREPWISYRVFSESIASLKARKEFVQYGIDERSEAQSGTQHLSNPLVGGDTQIQSNTLSQKQVRREAALSDLRWLIKEHGQEGVWLWDPFLSAQDVLRTLFFCPHAGVQLRALTAGKKPPEYTENKIDAEVSETERKKLARERANKEREDERAELEAGKGNCLDLKLEFRIRQGNAGWGFHDRFLIFPRSNGSALAWSLGTSINSFGDEHHILQKVSHGEPIAQAFRDLWGQLEGPEYIIWKTPTN